MLTSTKFTRSFNATVHLEVLKTLVESPSCPQAVIRLTGHGILALVSEPKAILIETKMPNVAFNTSNLRDIANRALGVTHNSLSSSALL